MGRKKQQEKTNPPADTSAVDKHSTKKIELECAKLEAETEHIRRPLWKQIHFWTAISTIVVTIGGGVYAWFSGWFDMKQRETKAANAVLDSQKLVLQADTQRAKADALVQQHEIQKELGVLNDRKSEISSQLTTVSNRLVFLEQNSQEMQLRVLELQGEKEKLLAETARLRRELASSFLPPRTNGMPGFPSTNENFYTPPPFDPERELRQQVSQAHDEIIRLTNAISRNAIRINSLSLAGESRSLVLGRFFDEAKRSGTKAIANLERNLEEPNQNITRAMLPIPASIAATNISALKTNIAPLECSYPVIETNLTPQLIPSLEGERDRLRNIQRSFVHRALILSFLERKLTRVIDDFLNDPERTKKTTITGFLENQAELDQVAKGWRQTNWNVAVPTLNEPPASPLPKVPVSGR